MATLQLECPESGRPVDIVAEPIPANGIVPAVAFSSTIACPHCGKSHRWTSTGFALAIEALHRSPDATRVLVAETEDGATATAFP
jgi:hypothetical protein